MTSRHLLPLLLGLVAVLPCHAEIYTLPGFTRPAGAASLTETFDFVTNDGWSGTPPNAISGESSVYLKVTVSWAAAANIGTFQTKFNYYDDGGAGRWGVGTDGNGFGFITLNATGDPDAAGPATAKPTVVTYDKTANTSVTLVLKVNQIKALTNPGGDWWFGDTVTPGAQDGACGFMWINPDLAATEAGQSTVWGAWRSGNTSYQGVSFVTDTADADLVFSNIAIYTGDDSPFAASSGIVDAATSTVSASPTSVPSNGTTTSTVTVTLKDSGGSPVAGKEVSLAGNGSATIATSNHTSDSGGVVTFTVKSGTPGTETFTATDVTDGNLVITQTASVNFQEAIATVAAYNVNFLDEGQASVTGQVGVVGDLGPLFKGADTGKIGPEYALGQVIGDFYPSNHVLISDVREVFNKPNLPFVIASTGMDTGPAESPPYQGYSAVEKAQLWVAGVAQPANTLSTDTRPYFRDASVSPSTQGYHWNWNAESQFLIGKALGDNMVNLLTAP